jgi:hypothetical protein
MAGAGVDMQREVTIRGKVTSVCPSLEELTATFYLRLMILR